MEENRIYEAEEIKTNEAVDAEIVTTETEEEKSDKNAALLTAAVVGLAAYGAFRVGKAAVKAGAKGVRAAKAKLDLWKLKKNGGELPVSDEVPDAEPVDDEETDEEE